MFKIFAKNLGVGQEQQRRLVNSMLRHQKEPHQWCQTWSFRTATNVQQAKEVLQKARQPKHGGYKTILEVWHKTDTYRKSLSKEGENS